MGEIGPPAEAVRGPSASQSAKMVRSRRLCLTLSLPHQAPCWCLQNARGTVRLFPLLSHRPNPRLQPNCPEGGLPVTVRPPCPSRVHTQTAARAVFPEGHESQSLSSCFTPAIPGVESTLLQPGPQAHVTSALTLHTPALSSRLPKQAQRSRSGLSLAVPSVLPQPFHSGSFPHTKQPPPAQGLAILSLLPSRCVPLLGLSCVSCIGPLGSSLTMATASAI